MPRKQKFTRRKKGGRHSTKQTPPAGELKATPDSDSISKQLNLLINVDLGSNVVPQFNEDDEQKNNPTNSPNPPNPPNPPKPPKSTATVETAKDPPIHTSNQREESSAINLNVALDDDVLDESPPNELNNTTIDQTKIILLLWLIQ